MKQYATPSMKAAVALAVALCASAGFASASTLSDEQSLRRAAVEDVTPQQKYQSAIREAGGAYKEARRDCADDAGQDRRACMREAKATYDREMADAKALFAQEVGASWRTHTYRKPQVM